MTGIELIDFQWLALALDITIKATLILALGGLLACRMRQPAAVRHRIWVATFAAIAVLPAVLCFAPRVAVSILPSDWSFRALERTSLSSGSKASKRSLENSEPRSLEIRQTRDEAANITLQQNSQNLPSSIESLTNPDVPLGSLDQTPLSKVVQKSEPRKVSYVSVLAVLWLSGAVLAFMPLGLGIVRSMFFAHTRKRITDHSLQQQLANFAAKLCLVRVPRLFLSDEFQMPMIMGCWKPIVVLPTVARDWNLSRTKSVLLHELAHIRRHDVLAQIAMRCVCCIYWFHPMVWWALGRVKIDREYACDDCALLAGCDAADYASELLNIAREYKAQSFYASAALSMAGASQLEGRLIAILNSSRMRDASGKRSGVAVILSIACMTILLSVLQLENKAIAQANERSTKVVCVIEGIIRTEAREPAEGAKIECIIHDHPGGNYFAVPTEEKIQRFETQADALGRFRLEVPRVVNRIPRMTALIASAANEFPIVEQIDLRMPQNQVGLQFQKSKQFEFQIVGDTGPITGLSPRLESLQMPGGESIASPHPLGHETVSSWPEVKAIQDGKYAVRLPALIAMFQISVNSPNHDARWASIPVAEELAQVKLENGHALVGTVEDQAGNPIENVRVVTVDHIHREVRTDKNGKFRLMRSQVGFGSNHLHFYPPAESGLLYRVKEWYWRPDIYETEETFVLKKGIMIEGRIVDKKTSKPIADAQLSYRADGENEYVRKNMQSPVPEMEPRYTSDQEGRFRIPVINGRGRLQVRQPNFDYKMMSKVQYPNMSGDAFRALAYEKEFDLAPDSKLEAIRIELEQGERITLQVQRPDGKAAKCVAMTPCYRFGEPGVPVMMPFQSIDGIMELPGGAVNCDVLLLDAQGQCGAVLQAPEHADGPVMVKLEPFGSTMIRIVGSEGQPNAGYQPSLYLSLRGIPVAKTEEQNSAASRENINWYSIVNARAATTNEQGIVKLDALLPGVNYHLHYLDEHRNDAQQDIIVPSIKAAD